MKNDLLDYYGEHQISPVRQDISDIETHYERRRKLYMQCGIPLIAFRDAEILEVGPGGGYNTLAFFHWNSRHVDLVEANQKGREDMQQLFFAQNISREQYDIFPCRIEDYQTDKKYDIVIAEGFISGIYNQQEVIRKLGDLTAKKGIVVITCIDDVSIFIEIMKRLVGRMLTMDLTEYSQKEEYLVSFFAPQLAKLRGVSREPKGWVQDQILNPATVNGTKLDIVQAIDYFGEEFDVLGSSPRMFTDYSWYKDIWYDNKLNYKNQFHRKRLSLLMAGMPEVILSVEKVKILVKHFENVKELEADYERTLDTDIILKIIKEINEIGNVIDLEFNKEFLGVLYEIKEILSRLINRENLDMKNYPNFFAAFGRAMQYVSFVKK